MNQVLAGDPLILPEYVTPCPLCGGEGQRLQTYTAGCGGGYYKSMGRCDLCEGWRYVFKATAQKVGESVLAQISTANRLTHALEPVRY